jgi:hypothetical protein
VWGLQGQSSSPQEPFLPAYQGLSREPGGDTRPPSPAGLPPHLQALLAVSAGGLAASPIQSLLRVQRTETKQNKLVSWPEQRAHWRGGPHSAAPCLSPLPLGALAVGSHILSATFLYLVFWEIGDDCKWSAGVGGRAFQSWSGP